MSADAEKEIRQGGERPEGDICNQHNQPATATSPLPEATSQESQPSPSPMTVVESTTPSSSTEVETCTSCAVTAEPTPTICWALDENGDIAYFEDGTPVPCNYGPEVDLTPVFIVPAQVP